MGEHPTPRVGDDVYIPSSLYLTHGVDDFRGGLCRIVAIHEHVGGFFVEVEEDPGTHHNWAHLMERQAEFREQYGESRGHPDPDYRQEFNEP
ncbi:MAG: hypothetical protein WD027_02400 [Gaiellales bacterium]